MALSQVFGPEPSWPDQDMIAISSDFDGPLVLAAYCSGVFPMPLVRTGFDARMGWWSPSPRGILPLSNLKVSASLKKARAHYTTTFNAAFDEVIAGCGDPTRPDGWIDADVVRVFTEFHRMGIAVSVETWTHDGELAGGLYGMSIGGMLAGESMFHRPDIGRDASKVALLALVDRLAETNPASLLDVQWVTPHLASLGAVEVSRKQYLAMLEEALGLERPQWPQPGEERPLARDA